MTTNNFGQRLREAREERGWTQKELAEISGTTHSTISRSETSVHNPKVTIVGKLAKALGVNPAWLMGADVNKYIDYNNFNFKEIPIVGTIAAGKPILALENIEGTEYVHESDASDFCLRVKGNSMTGARIYDGDLVYIRTQEDVENGEIAAVIINNEEATLKRIFKYNGMILLKSENPNIPDLPISKKDAVSLKIIGKAIAFKSIIK